jgi:hypothetical protein
LSVDDDINTVYSKHPGKMTWKFFEKWPNTSKKSHAHLQCVHNNCAKFDECQFKSVGGVDYTK